MMQFSACACKLPKISQRFYLDLIKIWKCCETAGKERMRRKHKHDEVPFGGPTRHLSVLVTSK